MTDVPIKPVGPAGKPHDGSAFMSKDQRADSPTPMSQAVSVPHHPEPHHHAQMGDLMDAGSGNKGQRFVPAGPPDGLVPGAANRGANQ